MSVNRKFLTRKDKYDKRDHMMMAPRRGVVPIPSYYNMLGSLGPVRDQGGAGSCTGNAAGGLADFLYVLFSKYFGGIVPSTDFFSALFIYAVERVKNGDFPQDAGSDSRTACQVLNQIGACLNSQMPYVDTEINILPSPVQTADAGAFKIGAYHRVLLDDNLQAFRSCLASGYCRIIGIPVYQGIQSDECATTGMLPIPASTDTPIGGHELLVYGYDDNKKVELVRNSWGPNWGVKGNLMIPYAYYAAVGGNDQLDSWTMHMGKSWKVA